MSNEYVQLDPQSSDSRAVHTYYLQNRGFVKFVEYIRRICMVHNLILSIFKYITHQFVKGIQSPSKSEHTQRKRAVRYEL